MSHLERALRRSRAENPDHDRSSGELALTPPTPNAAFASPWAFEEARPSKPPAASPRDDQPPAGPPAPALAAVPPPVEAATRPGFIEFSSEVCSKLVVGDRASTVVREQFRKIAASFYRMRDERPFGIVMVVSAAPGEGKTLTATNLALTLSESYLSRVLLVDADLRRPSVHRVFGLPNDRGLRDDLAAQSDRSLSTVRVSAHLDVLPAGAALLDPMSALTSERLRMILQRAAAEYEWVLLDTPPAALLPDAKILASLADAALLVVEAAETKCQIASRAVDAIGRDRIIGVVLNQIKDGDDLRNYDGYYGGHDRVAARD